MMGLVTEQPVSVFNMEAVRCGDLLYGRHCTWSAGKAGFVTAVTSDQLTVQYYPGIGNVTNHFHIPIAEVTAGDWEIRWSSDMTDINRYPETDETQQETGADADES